MTRTQKDDALISELNTLYRAMQAEGKEVPSCIWDAGRRLEELTQPADLVQTSDPNQLLAEVEAKRGQLLGVPDWTHKRLLAAEEVCKAITRGESDTNDFAAFWAWHKLWKGQE